MFKFLVIGFVTLTFAVVGIDNTNAQNTSSLSGINFTNYTSPVLGITLEVPANWTITDKENRFQTYDPLQIYSPHYQINIFDDTIEYNRAVADMGLENFTYDLVDNSIWIDEYTQPIEDVNMTKYKIGGYETSSYLYLAFHSSEHLTVIRDIFVNQDGHIWRIMFQGSPETFDLDKGQEMRDHIVNSITFNK
ncbi:MAG: hypothetical protein L0H53_00800 [Candidatus Nitrosocosmicus sp.]|nr:hypothetical protein [Candidatus Nitrosocosmicus sp.]MDN5865956.1 hypothetical protein [Candidatus Nitrosocosmicus sp.]